MYNHGSYCTLKATFGAKPSLFLSFFFVSLLAACSPEGASTDVDAAKPAEPNTAVSESTTDPQNSQSAEAQKYTAQCQTRYDQSSALFTEIAAGNHAETDEKLLTSINELDRQLDNALGSTSLYSNVHPDQSLRDAAEACQKQYVGLLSKIGLSRELYDQIAKVNTTDFSAEDKRYVENQLRDLRRSGVNLDKEKRDQVTQLNEEILLLGQTFSKNIRDDVRSIQLDSVDQLAGLPEDFIAAHAPGEDGKITITTNYPDYFPLQQYAKNDDARRALYIANKQRGYPANEKVLKDLLTKRHALATTLGYKNYAEYITETVMIKTPQHAEDFINKINAIAAPKATLEYQELLTKLKLEIPDATAVGDWQKTYISDLVKKEKYQVDSQEIRQYFPYKHVKQGILDLVETMFQVEIRPWETEVWHPSVTAHELVDHGKVIGRFYLDMHPREGKYKHAAAFSLQEGVKGVQLPIHALVCNFPGEASGDELMEHNQVETFLHELGHLLHGQFGGNQKWLVNAGTNTERDFVEAPSQMLEEWVWDADTLKSFAKNLKGETIPDDIIAKMNRARDYGKGIFTKHQMYYAAISLNFYNKDPGELSMVEELRYLKPRYSNFGYVDDTHFHLSFGHLYGYSAAYYTYMWSLVIATDMFSEFKKHGLQNPEIADRYRRTILQAGGSKDADQLIEDFLGRPYSFDAFAESLK
ncbi:MAG: Zn-dependent oligopeptidase [Agarilytica sp.]